MSATKIIVPADLKRVLPSMYLEIAAAEPSHFKWLFGMFLFFMGTVAWFLTNSPSFWLRLLVPLVGPLVTAGLLIVAPLNPYKSRYAELEGMDSVEIRNSSAAQKLVRLLRSAEARQCLLKRSLTIAYWVWGLVLLLSVLRRTPITLEVRLTEDPGWFAIHVFLLAGLSIGPHMYFLFRLIFEVWNSADVRVD